MSSEEQIRFILKNDYLCLIMKQKGIVFFINLYLRGNNSKMKLLKTSVIVMFIMAFLISTAGAATLDLSRLLLFYPCDENGGDVLKDASGNGWDADLPGGKWEKGVFGNAVRLKGTNSEVQGDILSSVGKTGEISMMCWVNLAAHTTYNGIISVEAPNEGDPVCCEFRIMVDPARSPFWNAGHHVDQNLDGIFTFELDTWYHYAMVANGEAAQIYIDGEMVGEKPEAFDLPELHDVFIYVGTGEKPGTWTAEDLALDEVMIWDKALDEDEIKLAMEGSKIFMSVDAIGKLATTWAGLKAE